MAVASLIPSLSLSYSQSFSAAQLSDAAGGGWSDWKSGSPRFSIGVGVSLSSLLPWSREMTSIKNADTQIAQARLALEQALVNAELDITNRVQAVEKALSSLEALQFSVELAEEALKLAKRHTMQAQESFWSCRMQSFPNRARQQLLSGKFNYLSGLLDLEYSINEQLTGSESADEGFKDNSNNISYCRSCASGDSCPAELGIIRPRAGAHAAGAQKPCREYPCSGPMGIRAGGGFGQHRREGLQHAAQKQFTQFMLRLL